MSWLHTLLGLSLLFVVGVNVMNAIGRYLFGISPVGADELMVYVVIWMVMIAAILSLILRSHINVNLLPLYTEGRARHLLHCVHDAAAVLACGYATYASWLFISRISKLRRHEHGARPTDDRSARGLADRLHRTDCHRGRPCLSATVWRSSAMPRTSGSSR